MMSCASEQRVRIVGRVIARRKRRCCGFCSSAAESRRRARRTRARLGPLLARAHLDELAAGQVVLPDDPPIEDDVVRRRVLVPLPRLDEEDVREAVKLQDAVDALHEPLNEPQLLVVVRLAGRAERDAERHEEDLEQHCGNTELPPVVQPLGLRVDAADPVLRLLLLALLLLLLDVLVAVLLVPGFLILRRDRRTRRGQLALLLLRRPHAQHRAAVLLRDGHVLGRLGIRAEPARRPPSPPRPPSRAGQPRLRLVRRDVPAPAKRAQGIVRDGTNMQETRRWRRGEGERGLGGERQRTGPHRSVEKAEAGRHLGRFRCLPGGRRGSAFCGRSGSTPARETPR